MYNSKEKLAEIQNKYKKKKILSIIACILFDVFAISGLFILRDELGNLLAAIIGAMCILGAVTLLKSEIKHLTNEEEKQISKIKN